MVYTKDQLATLLHVTKQRISAWTSPSKKTLIEINGLIDDSIPKNKEFIERKLSEVALPEDQKKLNIPKQFIKNQLKKEIKKGINNDRMVELSNILETHKILKDVTINEEPKNTTLITSIPIKLKEPKEVKEHPNLFSQIGKNTDFSMYMSENEKRQEELKLEKLQLETRLKQIEVSKQEGKYLESEKVYNAIKRWVSIYNSSLLEEMEKKIQYICNRENIDGSKAGKYKSEIPLIINECRNKAVDELENIFNNEQL